MNVFVLGLLVSRKAREEGASWNLISRVLVNLADAEVDTWASAANLLAVAA